MNTRNHKQYFIFRIAVFTAIYLLIFNDSFGQKRRNDLEKEKLENQKKIEETNKILDETRSKKTTTIGQLNVMTQQIKQRNSIIQSYIKEIAIIDEEAAIIENQINILKFQLNGLKSEYAKMIYSAAKSQDDLSKLLFIFSSEDFNQLSMRLKYFKQYSNARHHQADNIKKVAVKLRKKRRQLAAKRSEKEDVLATIRSENQNLKNLKNEQESVVKQLSSQEEQLMDEIEERKKAIKRLEKTITELIKKEMERAAAEAALAKKNKKTPEVDKISGSFASNKSRIIWPVEQGFISGKFGKHQHAVFQHVQTENLGVDIQTNKNQKVRNVFEGTVMAISEVPGMNQIIMIQHGEYYTFYAKLKSTQVKVGQKLRAKEFIGEVFTNEDEVSELQFQIWKGNEKQNPEDWLIDK
ncbi:MAG: peptidoglycan DD-metalloendopeptidase family protein [Bacteroidota bacterium]|nr:peptidoglycan DD-metalloendopeptidase family protein [Bacteroidota bacterium]